MPAVHIPNMALSHNPQQPPGPHPDSKVGAAPSWFVIQRSSFRVPP
jgi:hypothetical protein